MHRPYQQFTSLIVLVAALALVGGIAIVLVTSRDSLSFAPGIWFGSNASPQPTVAVPASPTASAPAVAEATDPPTAAVTKAVTESPSVTSTPAPTEVATEAPTVSTLPEGVTALAVVDLQGVAARLRDAPNGRVIGAVLKGTQVEVLEGRELKDGITWLEIRDPTGLTGWMSENLLRIIESGGAPAGATSTLVPETSLTPLPTLAGGVTGLAVVALDSGTAGRLRDAPGGRVIGGVPDGTQVEILQGREVQDGVTWLEIRDPTGLTGWMSEDLLSFPTTPQPD